jgi:hypothetical protein
MENVQQKINSFCFHLLEALQGYGVSLWVTSLIHYKMVHNNKTIKSAIH